MNKKFNHNPRYLIGDYIRNDLRLQRLRRSYDVDHTYNSIPVGAEAYDYSTIAPGVTDTLFFPNIDEEGNVRNEETTDAFDILMSPFRWAGHQLFGDYENAYDRFSEASVADSWRLFHEKRYQAEATSRLNLVNEAEGYLNEIKSAQDYADNLDKLYKLRTEYDQAVEKGDLNVAKRKQDEFANLVKVVKDYENKIKTDGRNSYINVDLFYDLNKATSLQTTLGVLKNLSPDGGAINFLKPADSNIFWDALHGLGSTLDVVGKWANTARLGIQNILQSGASLIRTKGKSAENRSNVLRQAIMSATPDDRWTDSMFINYSYDPNDKNNPTTETLRSKIKSYKDYWERELKSRKILAEEAAYKYKNGDWFFDPTKINPKFRQFSENNNSGLIGALLPDQILYSIAEMGSSYSDWENMGAMALTDAGMSALTRRLITFALKRSSVTQALVALSSYRNLKAAGRLREAAMLEKEAMRAEKLIRNSGKLAGYIENSGGVAQQALNLYFINRMREHETNSEVIDAWSTRVLNNAMSKNSDLPKVLEKTREYLAPYGVPVDKMSNIDLIQFALAYNIPTGDAVFEKEKEDGRNGLKKVYNDNMSLAAKDYAEAIPMLSFSGSFLRNMFRSGIVNNAADRMVVRSFTDSVIDKYLPKLTQSLSTKLKAKHTIDFLKRKAALTGYISTMEGIEEGQQELLQSRYTRGLYDKYTNPLTSFSMLDVINDTKLATEAVAAYLGVLYGDPDNGSTQIKRAMLIGAAVGGIMGGGGASMLTNIMPSTGYDNTRNLIAQIKNDNEIGRVIAEAYGTAQDDKHLDIFYDAFQKHGINNERLRKSLEDLKLFIPGPKEHSNINDSYIQRDIDLMERLWDSINDTNLKTLLKGIGIQPDSDSYRSIMKLAARYKLQSKDAAEFVKLDITELDQIKNSVVRQLNEYLYGRSEDYYEDDVYIPKNPDIEKFIDAVRGDYKEYQKENESAKKERELLERDIETLKQHEKESRSDYDDEEVIDFSAKLNKALKRYKELSKYKDKTFDEFIEESIDGLVNYRFLQNAIDLHNKLLTKQQLLEELSLELGIDVSSTMLLSILNRIQDQIRDIEKDVEDQDVLTKNNLIRELNKSRKSGLKKLKELPNISKRILDKYGNIQRASDIDHIQARMLLNRAVYDIIQPVARGFAHGEIDPRQALHIIEPLRWKSLSDEEKDLFIKKINEQRKAEGKSELSKKAAILMWHRIQKDRISQLEKDSKDYEKLLHDSTSLDEDAYGENLDLKLARKLAFEHLVEYEVKNREDLRRINHREFMRSNKSSIEIEEKAKEGDEDAKDVIELIIDEEDKQLPAAQPVLESQPTPPLNSTGLQPTNPITTSGTDITLGYDLQGGSIPQAPNQNEGGAILPAEPSGALKDVLDILGVPADDTSGSVLPPNQHVDLPVLPAERSQDPILPADNTITDAISTAEGIIEYETTRTPVYEPLINRHINEKSVGNKDQIYTDFLGQTFKYLPTATEAPIVANIRRIEVNGEVKEDIKPIIFKDNAKLGTGKLLAEKLMIPGWFDNTEKYFVITVNENKGSAENKDDLVVGMAIQDGDTVYITFMLGLTSKDNVFLKMDQMFYSYFEYDEEGLGQGLIYYLRDADGKFNRNNFLFGQYLARRAKYIEKNPAANPNTITEGTIKLWYDGLSLSDKDEVDFAVRKFLSGGRSVFSNEQIRSLITNLRNTRNLIIEACLVKDPKTGKYIIPENVYDSYGHIGVKNARISDGSFNDVKDSDGYVFRKLLGDGFGIPEDATTEDITKLIEDESFRVGLGRGERAFEGSEYAIDKLNPDSVGNYNDSGTGLAGKLYYIAKTLSGLDRAVELSEKKFRDSLEFVNPNDVDEAFDDSGKIIEGKVPTIAEFILRLITDNIDDSVFAGISPQFIGSFKEDLINLLVNAGHHTWVKGRDEVKYQHFAQKQFFYDEETSSLVISLPNKYGIYRHVNYKISEIYSLDNPDAAETNRKIIISAIANNLHWNTDRYTLTQDFSPIFLEALKSIFLRNKDLNEYKIAGIDDLSFNRDDLFDENMQNKHVVVLAWMIKTGKILTTKGNTLFKDPFVYADGPVVSNKPTGKNKKTADKKKNLKPADKKQIANNEEVVDSHVSNVREQLNEKIKKSFDTILKQRPKEKDDDILDLSILDVTTRNGNVPLSDEEISAGIEDAILRTIERLKKLNKTVDESKILRPNSGERNIVSSGNGVFVSVLFFDGSLNITAMTMDELDETTLSSSKVSGVYSTEKQSGILNTEDARAWLKSALGLLGHLIIVTNALMKGVNNEDVYGVLNVAVNVLLGEYYGVITFRKNAGDGVQYHEAFHYVNLLLHTEEQRNRIYKKFVELHPEFKNEKRSRLEEHLADGFIAYAQRLRNKELQRSNYGRVRKWLANIYDRFLDFINAWNKKDVIEQLYNDIYHGKYAGMKIDKKSLEEFKKAYDNNVNMTSENVELKPSDLQYNRITGFRQRFTGNFKSILNYHLLYAVTENVAHGFLEFANIIHAEDVQKMSKTVISDFFESLKKKNRLKKNPYIQDVIDNPEMFLEGINTLLRQYGIVPKRKTSAESKNDENVEEKTTASTGEEISDLTKLYENYTVDAKTNAQFRAKLFLCLIKDSELQYDEETETNESVVKIDPETGLVKYVPYEEAWYLIVNSLHNVESYEDIVNEVYRRSKTKSFFAQLYKKLLEIEGDILLLTQIFTTVSKHLTTVAQIQIKEQRQRRSFNIGGETETVIGAILDQNKKQKKVYDSDKTLEIINDNTLKARRMLPREWSKDLFASPLIKFDQFHRFDEQYVRMLKNRYESIVKQMNFDRKLTSDLKKDVVDKIFPELLKLLNLMSIPFDSDVLTEYIMIHVREQKLNSNSSESEQWYAALQEILSKPGSSTNKSANIAFFIYNIFNKKSSVVKVKKKDKEIAGILAEWMKSTLKLNEIYNGWGGELDKMAIAYNNIHPSSREQMITGPGNVSIYPIGENNFMSDIIRWINKNNDNIIDKLIDTPYAKNSKMLEAAKIIYNSSRFGELEFKLNVFVGMDDENTNEGEDYFGITSLEDVISKILMSDNNMIILPTMADKKTYYTILLVNRSNGKSTSNIFKLPHDILLNSVRRFSNETLSTFAGYFYDELNSVINYYDKQNINNVIKNKLARKKNFHGKIKDGKMLFGGNGGMFRYFYDIAYKPNGEQIDANLNQLLEFEYNSQQIDILDGEGASKYRENSTESLDGFESIRKRLQNIKNYYFEDDIQNGLDVIFTPKLELLNAINNWLFDLVDDLLNKFSKPGIEQLIRRHVNPDTGEFVGYSNRLIPTQIFSKYISDFEKKGIHFEYGAKTAYFKDGSATDLVMTVVGNFVVLQMISTIETEKIFSSDPAFYKWTYSGKDKIKVHGIEMEVRRLVDKDSDKIKRLGALLSPGRELRKDFTAEDIKKYPWLAKTKYTNAVFADVKARSIYADEMRIVVKKDLIADIIRSKQNKTLQDYDDINKIYIDPEFYKVLFDKLPVEKQEEINNAVEQQVSPFNDITVSDAQVLIRPDMYRSIRMRLGDWSTEPIQIKYKTASGDIKTTSYSDNEAFEILENDPSWMTDPEKAAKVSKLQLYPLKMSYYKNDPHSLFKTTNVAYGEYNKMAIFPAFKYLMTSKTGQQIYKRMNKEGLELDMITFESAVKVGASNDIYSPYSKDTEDLSTLNNGLDDDSGSTINDAGEVSIEDGLNILSVEVQEIDGLRMQLNTEAHEDTERSIGTQMFKILFGNIYDDEDYLLGKDGRTIRKGKDIRNDIMKCIKQLTILGVNDLKTRFYDDGKPDKKKILKYLKNVAKNNNVGESVLSILDSAGNIESLMQKTLFEHSVTAAVNRSVIDIITPGGSAILQSVFGFVSYGSKNVRTLQEPVDGFPVPNDGRELNWYEEDGSMEVMLSANFFRHIVPQRYQTDINQFRQWLINHDIVKGFKKKIVTEPNQGLFEVENLDKDLVEYKIVYEPWRDDESKKKKVLKIWLKGQKEKGSFDVVAEKDIKNIDYTGDYAVHFKTNNGKYGDENITPSTKEERSILFQYVAKVIPEGARVSTRGNVSVGGKLSIDRLGTENGWKKAVSEREVVSKETGEKTTVSIYIKPHLEKEEIKLSSLLDTSIYNIASFNTKIILKLENAGVETLKDIIKVGKTILQEKYKIDDDLILIIEDALDDLGMSFDTEISEYSNISKPKPFGVGYRIPTQGMSSTFAFTVADVLPFQSGDLIIVPREFTAQTGSDFDVDKLYLATLQYDEDGSLRTLEDNEDINSADKTSIVNTLIQNYIDVVTDVKTRANARASIDVITDIILNSTLKAIRGNRSNKRIGGYELTPYFQMQKKKEFSIGKSGIGPFALNTTNLALTQFAHITLDYTGYEDFGFRDLDLVKGRDGLRISDWLSAMVNAHVDVAKDPYIFDLNLNQYTYKFANFLLRAGMGESALLFLAQPEIKRVAEEYNNYGGIYGGSVEGEKDKTPRYRILDTHIDDLKTRIERKIDQIYLQNKDKKNVDIVEDIKDIWENTSFKDVFDISKQKEALNNPETLESLIFQLTCLKALKKIDPLALELSDLVKMSRIDTKKFGNTLAQQRDFINEYEKFKYKKRSVKWLNTDGSSVNPLIKYFSETFLDTKLYAATGIIRDILSTVMLNANEEFDNIVTTIFCEFFGTERNIVDDQHNKLTLYGTVYKKELVDLISNAIENVLRHKLFLLNGPRVFNEITGKSIDFDSDSYDWNNIEKTSGYRGPIDFTFGGHLDIMDRELKRIMFGEENSEDPYRRKSIFELIPVIIKHLENISDDEKREQYKGFIDDKNNVINELLLYLKPLPADYMSPIPTLLLKNTNRNTTTTMKNKLVSAFYYMLNSDSVIMRRLARDIAIYAYYSQYNMNTRNSFFDVVPPEYRLQYDQTLSNSIDDIRTNGVIFDSEDIRKQCRDVIDVMCRNFHGNDNVVPYYEIPVKKLAKLNNIKTSGYMVPYYVNGIPATILIGNYGNTQRPYIKIQDQKDPKKYTLYKAVGYYANLRDGEEFSGTYKWYLYTPVSKLGIHTKGFSQYEFGSDTNHNSIFDENEFDIELNKEFIKAFYNNFKQAALKKLNSEYDNKKRHFVSREIIQFVKLTTTDVLNRFKKDVHTNLDSNIKKQNTKTVVNPINYVQKRSEIVIKLSDNNINESVKQQSDAVDKTIASVGIILDSKIDATKADIEDAISIQMDSYKKDNPDYTEEELLKYYDKLKNDNDSFKDIINYVALKRTIKLIFDSLSENSYKIESVYITGDNLSILYDAVADVIYLNDAFEDGNIIVVKGRAATDAIPVDLGNTVSEKPLLRIKSDGETVVLNVENIDKVTAPAPDLEELPLSITVPQLASNEELKKRMAARFRKNKPAVIKDSEKSSKDSNNSSEPINKC